MVDPTLASARRARIDALSFDYAAQPTAAVAVCNLCGGAQFVVVSHRDRYGYPAAAHACYQCGLVFLNPRMTGEAYGRFYDGVYRPLVSAFHGRLIDADTIQGEQRDYARAAAAFIRPYVEHAGLSTLLDIGGSTGVVAGHFASTFGLEGLVIDPAPLELERARALGLETATGLVESYDFGGRRFDLVLICQTVDHLLDVSGTLSRVRELIANRGLLFVDIVDFRAAYLRQWSVEDAVKIDHPYYLTEAVMMACLRRAGFDVVRVEYAADHLHIGFACRPGAVVAEALPARSQVESFLAELRYVQNAPRPA
jgi:hypothetical protein